MQSNNTENTTTTIINIFKTIFGLIVYAYLIYENVTNQKEIDLIVWLIPAVIMGLDLSKVAEIFKK